MPDIFTLSCRIFNTALTGIYTSECRFLSLLCRVFTSGMPDIVIPGFLISMTGICNSACRIFMWLCRVFTLGVPDIFTQ
jgi:hypothetical protein